MGTHATTDRTPARPKRRSAHHVTRRKGDERGLTTLEWLLIVAAVAGLAALAVVLVQNVVDDTAEQLGGASARETAANVAADTVEREARTADVNDARFNSWPKWEQYFKTRCERLQILYSDTNFSVDAEFRRAVTGDITAGALSTADREPATNSKPQVMCVRATPPTS